MKKDTLDTQFLTRVKRQTPNNGGFQSQQKRTKKCRSTVDEAIEWRPKIMSNSIMEGNLSSITERERHRRAEQQKQKMNGVSLCAKRALKVIRINKRQKKVRNNGITEWWKYSKEFSFSKNKRKKRTGKDLEQIWKKMKKDDRIVEKAEKRNACWTEKTRTGDSRIQDTYSQHFN